MLADADAWCLSLIAWTAIVCNIYIHVYTYMITDYYFGPLVLLRPGVHRTKMRHKSFANIINHQKKKK